MIILESVDAPPPRLYPGEGEAQIHWSIGSAPPLGLLERNVPALRPHPVWSPFTPTGKNATLDSMVETKSDVNVDPRIKAVGEVMIRLRMGAHDGHYAGGLVDGARMLGLFGDVATELLIRLDGDEGLFRAYEKVDFLAPVFVGDYIEATGRIISIGKSSRRIEFVAQKVVTPCPPEKGGKAVSSANFLRTPEVVCRAIGTCVTPLEAQRGTTV